VWCILRVLIIVSTLLAIEPMEVDQESQVSATLQQHESSSLATTISVFDMY